jgi:hypothetical protein
LPRDPIRATLGERRMLSSGVRLFLFMRDRQKQDSLFLPSPGPYNARRGP